MAKIRFLIFFLLILVGCKIDIESPYEDAVGISVEYLETHDVQGDKFIFLGDTVITKYNSFVYSNLRFYDIRLPDERLAQYYFGEIVNDFALFDKYIITAFNDSMIKVINFSNLENIYIMDSLKLESPCQSLIVKSSYIYALGLNKIFIINCSDINNLNIIKTLSFDNELTDFVDYGEKLYVAAGEKCLILDIKTTDNPYLTDSLLFNSYADRLNINKNYLYWISYGIQVYNLNNKKWEGSLNFPDRLVNNVFVFDKFGLTLTHYGNAYLLNLEYPSRPAALKMVESNCDYGMIREDKIYLLGDELKVFLIKKTD